MTIKSTRPTYSCLSHIVDTKQNGGMEGDMEYMVYLLKPEPTKAKTNLKIGEVSFCSQLLGFLQATQDN